MNLCQARVFRCVAPNQSGKAGRTQFNFSSLCFLSCLLWWLKHLTALGFVYHHAECPLFPFKPVKEQELPPSGGLFLLLDVCCRSIPLQRLFVNLENDVLQEVKAGRLEETFT